MIKHYLNEAMTPKTKLTIGARTAWCGKIVFYRQKHPNNHTNMPGDVTCKKCEALLQSVGVLKKSVQMKEGGV